MTGRRVTPLIPPYSAGGRLGPKMTPLNPLYSAGGRQRLRREDLWGSDPDMRQSEVQQTQKCREASFKFHGVFA
jgi:hypothetical protein